MLLLIIMCLKQHIDFLEKGKDILEKANKKYTYYISVNTDG